MSFQAEKFVNSPKVCISHRFGGNPKVMCTDGAIYQGARGIRCGCGSAARRYDASMIAIVGPRCHGVAKDARRLDKQWCATTDRWDARGVSHVTMKDQNKSLYVTNVIDVTIKLPLSCSQYDDVSKTLIFVLLVLFRPESSHLPMLVINYLTRTVNSAGQVRNTYMDKSANFGRNQASNPELCLSTARIQAAHEGMRVSMIFTFHETLCATITGARTLVCVVHKAVQDT